MAELGNLDAIVFTGGIGENSAYVRRLATEGLAAFGIVLDHKKNDKNAVEISAGPVKVLVVPTNEELAIARDTKRILESAEIKEAIPPRSKEEKRLAALSPNETARLVLIWAKNPKSDLFKIEQKLGKAIGRSVGTDVVRNELERLSLLGAPERK